MSEQTLHVKSLPYGFVLFLRNHISRSSDCSHLLHTLSMFLAFSRDRSDDLFLSRRSDLAHVVGELPWKLSAIARADDGAHRVYDFGFLEPSIDAFDRLLSHLVRMIPAIDLNSSASPALGDEGFVEHQLPISRDLNLQLLPLRHRYALLRSRRLRAYNEMDQRNRFIR